MLIKPTLLVIFLVVTVATPYDIKVLAEHIYQSNAFPTVGNYTNALHIAVLLNEEMYNYKQLMEKTQPQLINNTFRCVPTGRTYPKPTDARKLKPDDIDVVAAIGDSIVAGFGALSNSIFTLFKEYRGHSFCIGGQTSYEDFITVPNIIKKYNPNVKGFATGSGSQWGTNAVLNVAVSGTRSYQLQQQLDVLYNRMTQLGVDIEKEWKLISIFVGGNDLCDYCTNTVKNSPANYRHNIEEALDTIKVRFPRVFVNLISPPDVTLISQVSTGFCSLLHYYECRCSTDSSTTIAHRNYTNELIKLVASPKYQEKTDFHVSLQPFLSELELPRLEDGKPDRSYFAPDCFHFSGKAHQAASIALWNNMLESTHKNVSWVPGEQMRCSVKYIT